MKYDKIKANLNKRDYIEFETVDEALIFAACFGDFNGFKAAYESAHENEEATVEIYIDYQERGTAGELQTILDTYTVQPDSIPLKKALQRKLSGK